MTMTTSSTKVTATELARNLSDILNRIQYRGERFTVERNGETIAELGPALPENMPTLRDLADRMRSVPRPDDAFADDLENITDSQPLAEFPEWPTS